jgi:glycosyltransferase involved in cell wall biosynthesis/predicted phosphodiesterase
MSLALEYGIQTKACRIACFSDTYGQEANNGVGRFLSDLRRIASQNHLPLEMVVPGKQSDEKGVTVIKAPSFALPGYPDLKLSMPLEHQRKSVLHRLKAWKPDVIHVSTPGPMGCFGISLARQLYLPLVGIYHTDFPSYAREIVQSQIRIWSAEPKKLLSQIANLLMPVLRPHAMPIYKDIRQNNANFDRDLATVYEILKQNYNSVAAGLDGAVLAGHLAHLAMADLLKRFYSTFSMVIARSTCQQMEIERTLELPPEKIRCLTPGTDVERFHPKFADRDHWEALGVPKDSFIALYVGRINSEKNFGFLLKIWEELQNCKESSDQKFCLAIVGRGDTTLIQRAKELPNVHILGAQQGERLSTLYASADALLFPSTTETLGQVGLEAGASGLPVLVTNQGGPQMYVRDGQTGYILPSQDAKAWAGKLLELSRSPDLQKSFSNAARMHIAQNHTIGNSLLSYWNIHQEAATNAREARQADERKKKRSLRSTELESGSFNFPGVLIISDYHAGKKFGSASQRLRKETALQCMLQRAVDDNLDVIFGGDFGDHGAHPERSEADFAMLRSVRKRVGLATTPTFVRGNHDYGYTDLQLAELTGGCHVQSSLVYSHAASGVTFTHGHILGLSRVLQVIQNAECRETIELALREEALDEELTPSVIAYDLANLIESYTQQKGLTGLGTFWERLFQTRGRIAETILSWGEHANHKDERTWKLIASLIGSHNDEESAAKLGKACGSWATIYGHTHEPFAKKLRLSTEKQSSTHVVGNSGNMNRRRPSCILARFPNVCVYRFQLETGKLKLSQRAVCKMPAETFRFKQSTENATANFNNDHVQHNEQESALW